MNRPTLLRHPRLHKRESFLGYVLRVSEVNGYSSPRHLRQFAGIENDVSLASAEGLAALGAVSKQTLLEARSAAAINALAGATQIRLIDADFIPTAEWTLVAKCCPLCIHELGFIEAHWSLPHMIACPVHRYLGLSSCSACKQVLRWHRPGLLECSCGATLEIEETRLGATSELALLDLIRRKALGIAMPKDNPESLPVESLMSMTLVQLVNTVDTLARLQGAPTGSDKRQAVYVAARALSNWPQRFLELIEHGEKADRAAGFRRDLNRYLRALCGPDNAQESHTAFLGAVMVEYALRKWNYRHSQIERFQRHLPTGLLDHLPGGDVLTSTLASETGATHGAMIEAADAAQYLGCSSTAIQGLVRSGKLQGNIHGAKWKVEVNSMEAFRREYVFLVEIARAANKAVETARRTCIAYRIQMFTPRAEKRSGIQLYIAASEANRLKELLSRNMKWKLKVGYRGSSGIKHAS